MGAQHTSTHTDRERNAPRQICRGKAAGCSALALLLVCVFGVTAAVASISDTAVTQSTTTDTDTDTDTDTADHAPPPAAANPAPEERIRLTEDRLQRLQALADALAKKRAELTALTSALTGVSPEQDPEMHGQLAQLNTTVSRLSENYEKLALQDLDTSLLEEPEDEAFNWQQETIEIVEPVFDSIKAMTRRPRQIARLRNAIAISESKLATANTALETFRTLQQSVSSPDDIALNRQLSERWELRRDTIEQDLLIQQGQLLRLEEQNEGGSIVGKLVQGTQAFLAGRGLTLLYALAAAIIAWSLMQLTWKLFNDRLSKQQRRRATWYRLLAYSFKLITAATMLTASITVLYLREDVLLMAISFLVLAGIALSLRNILPRFIDEGRLLLNLGAVREGELVMYNGLPWLVMSLNLQTVLRNPELEGVIRLPLSTVASLVSRPVPDHTDPLLFPTRPDDCVLLPDTTFGRVVRQTPEMVILNVRGGMMKSIPTAEFFGQSITNLSRSESFGLAVTFGLDYELQSRSLDEIPKKLNVCITAALHEAGYENVLLGVLTELKAASNSSLDFLIWMSFKSAVAPDYFKLERLATQACVAAANDEQWNIPFPQMMVHHRKVG